MSTEVVIGLIIWYLVGLFSNIYMMYKTYSNGNDITLFDITMGILTSTLGFIVFLILLETNPIIVLKSKKEKNYDYF